MKGKKGVPPLTMSCGGQGNLQGLYALLRWTFCQLFNTPVDHYDAAEQAIVHRFWGDETQFGDEIEYHDKAVREAKKVLAPTPEMHTAIGALAYVIQIQHRQGQIEVKSTIKGDRAIVLISCNTADFRRRGESFRAIDKNTLRILIKKGTK